jgi:A/G-specific adenine glycosylase
VALREDGHLLVRTRAAEGLLGGMTEVPTTDWTGEFDTAAALQGAPTLAAKWRRLPGVVTHTFTHFPLELVVYAARLPARARAPCGMRWVARADLVEAALPSLMRKVIVHAGIR